MFLTLHTDSRCMTNNSITNSKLIAETFNEYFVNIGPRQVSESSDNPPEERATTFHNIDPITNRTCHFHNIYVENIASALMNLKVNKSTGFDKIPANLFRLSANIIAPSLTYIFNLSLNTGIYIDDWERARVSPIYKSEDRWKSEN